MSKWVVELNGEKIETTISKSKKESIELFTNEFQCLVDGLKKSWKWWEKHGAKVRRMHNS